MREREPSGHSFISFFNANDEPIQLWTYTKESSVGSRDRQHNDDFLNTIVPVQVAQCGIRYTMKASAWYHG
jgi:hypothetical protein